MTLPARKQRSCAEYEEGKADGILFFDHHILFKNDYKFQFYFYNTESFFLRNYLLKHTCQNQLLFCQQGMKLSFQEPYVFRNLFFLLAVNQYRYQ
ncbi:hypothetical protein EGY05_04225 [Chryseobacterium arthrosphaerae]|nr:hypothetical protein EGY05_04225 [Chryseobacterium arthrosphaerae]